MKKICLFLIALITIPCLVVQANSQPNSSGKYGSPSEKANQISNQFMTATFDTASKTIRLTTNKNHKTFLRNLIPDNSTAVIRKEKVTSPVFGEGNSLMISSSGGGSVSFALFPSQPFLFVNQVIRNEGTQTIDIAKLHPVSFLVDLGKPASEVKTLGTGGLLPPDSNPGSYVFLTTVDPSTRNGVVAGWLTNEKGCGVLFSSVKDNQVEIKTQIDYGHFLVPSGKTEATETLVIGYFDDARLGEECFADLLAREHAIKLKTRSAVYCTWYSEKNGGAGSESSTIELTKYIKENLKPFGLGAIQIDDQWQGGDQYNGPHRRFDQVDPKGGYPNGMTTTAQAIKKEGLSAGIWWMPFSRNHQDPEYKERQHWFAYRPNGKPYETPWGGTSLDLTLPEVQDHLVYMAKTMQNWGFDYFKMDGLWTGTVTEQIYINDGYKDDSIGNCKPLHNPMITQIEAFRNGLRLIRKTTGEEVFLSGCCISQNMRSFGPSIGLVNSMRIGPDFNSDGQSIRTGAIRASRLYFLNGRVWWNDPDPSMLRENGLSTADPGASGIGGLIRARLLPSFVAVTGQFFLSSDWLPDLPENRIEIMKRTMASHSGVARPVDGFDKNLPSIWTASDQKTGTLRNIIGLFNWETSTQNIGCQLKWAGLKENTTYHSFDFWGNKPLPDIRDSITSELSSESCLVIALRAKSDHPVVVSTSQHVTQGMIDLTKETWNNGTLSGTSKIIGGDNYEIRIAGMDDGATWKLASATIIGNSRGTSIEPLPQKENGWLRILVRNKESQIIQWQLKFTK